MALKLPTVKASEGIYHPQMDIDVFLDAFDQALDSQVGCECGRAERLALAVWWLVDRLADELSLAPWESSAQVQVMAAAAADQMSGTSGNSH